MEPMMRSKQTVPILVGPAYQYSPRALLFSEADDVWPHLSLKKTVERIADLLPQDKVIGWRAICSGKCRGLAEPAANDTARWIEQHGRSLGFRTPTTAERSRVMDLVKYHARLNLPDHVLYDAQGNAFDRGLLPCSIGPALQRWAGGTEPPRHAFPAAAQIEEGYQSLRRGIQALRLDGLLTAPTAVPPPIASRLLLATDGNPAPWAALVAENAEPGTPSGSGASPPATDPSQEGTHPHTPTRGADKNVRGARGTQATSRKLRDRPAKQADIGQLQKCMNIAGNGRPG